MFNIHFISVIRAIFETVKPNRAKALGFLPCAQVSKTLGLLPPRI
jgi:hypothetical protein